MPTLHRKTAIDAKSRTATPTSTDADHYEPSPSTGWRETARILDAVAGIGEVVA